VIVWSPEARDSLDRIGARIASFAGEPAGRAWRQRVSDRVELAEMFPFLSREVPEYALPNLREVFESDYRILFRIVPDGIEVAILFHGSMSLSE
jgi:plasmid stabilization system protein ParE